MKRRIIALLTAAMLLMAICPAGDACIFVLDNDNAAGNDYTAYAGNGGQERFRFRRLAHSGYGHGVYSRYHYKRRRS